MQSRKYHLPYPAPFPNWSKYYQPAVTSRPFLTVDHKYAHLSPRLFPVQLAANLIHPAPSPKSNSALTIPQASSSSSSCRTTNFNNLCVVPDSSCKTPLIGATPDSTLGNLAIYQLDGDDEFVKNTVLRSPRASAAKKNRNNHRSNSRNNIPVDDYNDNYDHADTPSTDNIDNSINNNNVLSDSTKSSAVYGLQAVECDDDGGLLLAELSNNLCVGRYNSGGKELIWVEDIPLPNLRACDVNRIALTEFAAIDNFSLSLYDIATASCTLTEDIQPISPTHTYCWIHYAAHPRTVLVASKRNICRFDLRQPSISACMEVVNPVDAWNLCAKVDNGISYFENHPKNPFMSILTTGSVLAVMDHRMVRNPLLEWNITFGNDISNAALMGLNDNTNDLAIAVSANVTSDLALFHITSDFKVSAEEILLNPNDPLNMRRFHSYTVNYDYNNINGTESDDYDDGPVVKHPHMLWSDMPLCHLEQFPPGNELRGIALLPEKMTGRTKKFSLVQASPRYGIIAQRIGCEKFKDGTYVFEAPHENIGDGAKDADVATDMDMDTGEEERGGLLYGVDSAVDILNTRDAMLVESEGLEAAAEIIQLAVEPGMRMVKRLKCLDTRDVLAVRKVLEGDGEFERDDDGGAGGSKNKKKRKHNVPDSIPLRSRMTSTIESCTPRCGRTSYVIPGCSNAAAADNCGMSFVT